MRSMEECGHRGFDIARVDRLKLYRFVRDLILDLSSMVMILVIAVIVAVAVALLAGWTEPAEVLGWLQSLAP